MSAMTEAQIEARRKGAQTTNRADTLAMRLARAWDTLDKNEQARIAALLRPLIGTESPRRGRPVGEIVRSGDK